MRRDVASSGHCFSTGSGVLSFVVFMRVNTCSVGHDTKPVPLMRSHFTFWLEASNKGFTLRSAAEPQPNGPRPFWAQRFRTPRPDSECSQAQSVPQSLQTVRPQSGTGTAPMLGAACWQGNKRRRNPARLSAPHVLRLERPRSGKSSRLAKIFAKSHLEWESSDNRRSNGQIFSIRYRGLRPHQGRLGALSP